MACFERLQARRNREQRPASRFDSQWAQTLAFPLYACQTALRELPQREPFWAQGSSTDSKPPSCVLRAFTGCRKRGAL
jgi:hypothetical protein